MYQLILTTRYLTSRIIPLIAVAAVALCVALVIVVVSVMTGFLNMVQSSGRTLMGDVIISYGVSGISHYESLIDTLEADEMISAATPIVDGWGLLRMPYPDSDAKQSETVQVWGIDPDSFAQVTKFAESIQWNSPSSNQRDWLLVDAITKNSGMLSELLSKDLRIFVVNAVNDASKQLNFAEVDLWETLKAALNEDQWTTIINLDERLKNPESLHAQGLNLTRNGKPAIVSGLHVSDGNERLKDGSYKVIRNDYWWLPRFDGTLTMLPIDAQGGMIDPESIILPFANEFISGVFLIDESRIFVPLEIAQQLMHLDAAELVNKNNPSEVIGTDPARVTSILIRGNKDAIASSLQLRTKKLYKQFFDSVPKTELILPPNPGDPSLTMHTWEEQQRSFTGPVEKERELMRTLFSIIYLVVAALILSIFWSIVFEKTRDIGILRSIGASRISVVWIFLQYALCIGIAGSVFGLVLGWLITANINVIHGLLGNPPLALAIGSAVLSCGILYWMLIKVKTGAFLPIVLGSIGLCVFAGISVLIFYIRSIGGLVIWDASVYYFSIIPNQVDWPSAIITCIGAITFCLIGAAIPAAKAADTDPVRALRHE